MIDFAEDLRQTLVSLARENKALSDNLTAVQTRCTELLEEKRLLYKMCETLRHERNLAAESVANGFWLWSDTDDNWLDGLTNDALITMSAAQLRELIAERRARELEDQRATGDVLAGILGRERCVDGNVCLANDVALKIEVLEQQIHELSHDKACSEILERDQYEAISNLNARLRENERLKAAMRAADAALSIVAHGCSPRGSCYICRARSALAKREGGG